MIRLGGILFLLLLAADSVPVPSDPGLYYLNPKGLARIEGRAVTLSARSHRVPLSGPLPIGGGKVSAEIIGEGAEQKVTSAPVFYYRVPPGSDATGAGDLVLIKLKRRRGRRDFELSPSGEWQTNAGISLRSQVQYYAKQVSSGVYKLVPAHDLDAGEYGFYLFRGHDLPGFIYDFAVEDGR